MHRVGHPAKSGNRLVLPKYRNIAESLVNGVPVSSIDKKLHIRLMAPLGALRTRAILTGDQEMADNIDKIMSQLVLVKEPPANGGKGRERISPTDRKNINMVIDALLTDSEIESIEPEFVAKLRTVMKERLNQAAARGDFKLSKKLKDLIKSLEKFEKKESELSPEETEKLIQQYKETQKRIQDLKLSLEKDERDLEAGRDEAEMKAEQQFEANLQKYEQDLAVFESGGTFVPSKGLKELYEKEAQAYANEELEEEAFIRKQRMRMEKAEMFEYNKKNERIFAMRYQRLEQSIVARRESIAVFWDQKLNRLRKMKQPEIDNLTRILEGIKRKFRANGVAFPDDDSDDISTGSEPKSDETPSKSKSQSSEADEHDSQP